jgi:ubiquinone/menaquinone biosynthesis C-methylase UbiE
MKESTERFIPALGRDWLTPLYDLVAPLVRERRFKTRLVELANIAPGHDVLDIGCGTGTLALLVQARQPAARVVGIDIDPRIVTIARRKIARAGASIEVREGSATDPPFPPASFDRILSSLMLHHLTTAQKRETFAAARRLLRPGGELHVADWGKPHNAFMRVASLSFRLADGSETTGVNLRGELPALIAEAGFIGVAETERWMTLFGTLAFVRAAV